MSLYQFAHVGEGHSEDQLQNGEHTEVAPQNKESTTGTVQPVSSLTTDSGQSILLPIIFVGALVAIIAFAVIVALRSKSRK